MDLVKKAHFALKDKNFPFKLNIYQKGEDTYIDIVALDGKTEQVLKQNLTDDELEEFIRQIKNGCRLILDTKI